MTHKVTTGTHNDTKLPQAHTMTHKATTSTHNDTELPQAHTTTQKVTTSTHNTQSYNTKAVLTNLHACTHTHTHTHKQTHVHTHACTYTESLTQRRRRRSQSLTTSEGWISLPPQQWGGTWTWRRSVWSCWGCCQSPPSSAPFCSSAEITQPSVQWMERAIKPQLTVEFCWQSFKDRLKNQSSL